MALYRREIPLKDGRVAVIRNPEEADAEAMIEMIDTVDRETPFLAREPGEFRITTEQERGIIAARREDVRCLWVLAEVEGRIVGICDGRPRGGRSRFRHRFSLGIVVMRAYWGLGIGRAMMLAVIEFCKDQGFEHLELEVVAPNHRAIALYESLGFTIVGTMPRGMKYADGSYADEHTMWLDLMAGR